jgi:hypothetical protein
LCAVLLTASIAELSSASAEQRYLHRGSVIFYRKAILSCKDQILNNLVIEYPVAQKQAFDALMSHVAASMRSSPGERMPKCR